MDLDLPGPPLPIDAIVADVISDLRRASSVVVEAPPGAGKTTRLPLALLAAGLAGDGELLVLQPRRLAARMAAARVAELLGEPLGARVGYQVRFDARVGPQTRLRFVTEGILTRRLQSDPELRGVSMVILDEFHERHLDGDLALALLRRLQAARRPELRLVVMSATLDGEPIAAYLGAPRRTSEGRAFPVTIDYLGDDGELPSLVLRAFHGLCDAGIDGDTLVFLPGASEIRRCAAACAGLAAHAGVLVLPLHGELPPAEQDRAVRPAAQPKLILATNVAETSITIDGVTTVIDSGLCRIASHNHWSGIPTLQVAKIARSSATQRAGRAGRTRAGRCLRLYSQFDHDRRAPHTTPEIARLDLAGALLDLHAAGIADPGAFAWLEAPPAAALAAAEALLRRLGALAPGGGLSPTGRAMLRYPVHPRLARMMVEGARRGVIDLAAGSAAILSERSLRRDRRPARIDADADVLIDLADLAAVERQGPQAAERLGLSLAACQQAKRAREHLARLARGAAEDDAGGRPTAPPRGPAEREEALRIALLTAFPDRVGLARGDGDQRTLVLCGGGSARLAESSVVRTAPWALALAIEERRGARGGGEPRVTSACAIEPEWLLDLFPAELDEREELAFVAERGRVEGRAELRYHGLVLDASPLRRLPAAASELLREAALAAGPGRFVRDAAALSALQARTAFAAAHDPAIPTLDEDHARAALAALCEGLSSFAELDRADLFGHLQAEVQAVGDRLDRLAPTHARLAGGRRAAIRYAVDAPPSIASRLQDFFGLERGPTVAGGRVPVVLHLLAPNGRDLQVTTDLAGFWDRHYPELRRALMRRYPRHAWPEDPRQEPPPRPPRPPRPRS